MTRPPMIIPVKGYYSGTSGLVLPYRNKAFYPPAYRDKSALTCYGSLYNSIEINSSFYKVPQPATVQKWAQSVPGDFRFTFKLWKDITHQKNLVFDPAAVAQFMDTISAAQPKQGCLLLQLPPGARFSHLGQLQQLLAAVVARREQASWNVAVEFRHASWYREETCQLLEEHHATMVIHDKTGSEAPMDETDAPFIYLRFHGPGGNYRGSYDDAFLHEYAGYIRDWLREGKEVYVYFNNTMGDATPNLVAMNNYVRAS